jgi:arylsulfatase A-like enzyme
MTRREQANGTSGGKARPKRMATAAAAPKRMATAKKSAPQKKKPAVPAKKAMSTIAKKPPTPAKKPAAIPAAKPAPAAPRPATPLPAAAPAAKPPPQPAARPAAAASSSVDEKRRAATRRFFARLRSLEAIIGADLRKRGSLVLMQAVDQWYSEAISATATDVSITNAAKAVIAHL